jgi:hypothetical protein
MIFSRRHKYKPEAMIIAAPPSVAMDGISANTIRPQNIANTTTR